jgi:hypothetical protein
MKNEMSENDMELLSAWLDGECDSPAALQARLKAEPELALRLRQLQAVRAGLAALSQPNPPADFAARVTDRAYARKLPLPARKFWLYAVPAAAAALLLVVAGLTHKTPKQLPVSTDDNDWRIALNAAAESPDAEDVAELVDEETALDETSPSELTVALADLSSEELGGGELAEADGIDTDSSVIDMIDELSDVEAAVLAAKLKSGA